MFKDKRIRERQLFISLSCLDLRPLEASLFRYMLLLTYELVYLFYRYRGKCEVFQLTKETQLDLETLFDTQDQFFYSLAYNQESRYEYRCIVMCCTIINILDNSRLLTRRGFTVVLTFL